MAIDELRVHGVSGTPPRSMLYTDPVPVTEDDHVKVYSRPGTNGHTKTDQVQAFHWGGLTSGSRLTALWVLLLPFAFANAAGWMTRTRGRCSVAAVRLFGLILTGVFVNMAVTATIDVFWHWSSATGIPSWVASNRLILTAALFVLLGLGWWQMVTHASTRSHFSPLTGIQRQKLLWHPDPEEMLPPNKGGPSDDEAWRDPVRSDSTDPVVWDVHAILHRLRRIHLGFGYLMLGYAAAVASDTGWEVDGFGLFDIPTGVVLILMTISIITLLATGCGRKPAGAWLKHVTAWQPIVGVVACAAAVAVMVLSGVESSPEHWAHLHDTSAGLVGVGLGALLLVLLCGRITSAAAGTFAALFGVVLGAGITLVTSEPLGIESFDTGGMDWLSAAVLAWLIVVVIAIVATMLVHARRRGISLWEAIHETTGNLTITFGLMPAAAILMGLIILWKRCDETAGISWRSCIQDGSLGPLPDRLGTFTLIGVALAWVILIVVFLRTKRIRLGLGTLVGALLVFLALRKWTISVAGVELSLADIDAAARTFAVALPAAMILRRLTAGLTGGQETRRGTGVIWDVLMFWPRWFHPLAPPSYGPHVVKTLRKTIETKAGGENKLVVSAHSQGTVIALITLHQLSQSRHDLMGRLGFITYGSPIEHLYARYFPSAELANVTTTVRNALTDDRGTRWSNLHRATDPIGGPIDGPVDVDVPDPRNGVYRLHSGYEADTKFERESDRIIGLLTAPPQNASNDSDG